MGEIDSNEFLTKLKFDEQGLIPTIVQDFVTHRVLMVAYMNRESLDQSLRERQTYFWSRSRREIWHKGATSGNIQRIVGIDVDCDGDALLVWVDPQGPACHTGAESCFFTQMFSDEESGRNLSFSQTVEKLVRVIKDRKVGMPEGSYTTYLFSKGIDKILKKIGEESAETIIAAKNRSRSELVFESADLLYHLLVLFVNEGLEVQEVLTELERRAQKSTGISSD
jgi:phosphoribosyl-AMP cyclohydrolase / phosphoribosyl-ATP pyrophosphohydrolase